MTLREEGKIDGRRFAVLLDEETGEPRKFACLACQKETKPDGESFAAHECRAASEEQRKAPTRQRSTSNQDGEG